jgi:peptidoglycan/LPS O-acetylase OafA/YrhL
MQVSTARLSVLDSYRAIAALAVVAHHYFYGWSSANVNEVLTPIPGFVDNPVFVHGELGVQFFFMISGFVISLTLEKTSTIYQFAVKRFARLFPAMLFCASMTFLLARALGIAPFSAVTTIDFLPSLTFMDPRVINGLFGLDSDYISAVYWSLFVEVKFYFLAAVLYFWRPKQLFVSFTALMSICAVVLVIAQRLDMSNVQFVLYGAFFPMYAWYFVAGIGFYELFRNPSNDQGPVLVIVLLSYVINAIMYGTAESSLASAVYVAALIAICYGLFWMLLYKPYLAATSKLTWLSSVGVASYSLYLIHESIGVSLIRSIELLIGGNVLVQFLVILLAILFSSLTYRWIETPARRFICGRLMRHDEPLATPARAVPETSVRSDDEAADQAGTGAILH